MLTTIFPSLNYEKIMVLDAPALSPAWKKKITSLVRKTKNGFLYITFVLPSHHLHNHLNHHADKFLFLDFSGSDAKLDNALIFPKYSSLTQLGIAISRLFNMYIFDAVFLDSLPALELIYGKKIAHRFVLSLIEKCEEASSFCFIISKMHKP